ncbi:FapA family protein [Oscillospiraceae bacterium PP1C4]
MNKQVTDIEDQENQRTEENISEGSDVSNSFLYKLWKKITDKRVETTDSEPEQEPLSENTAELVLDLENMVEQESEPADECVLEDLTEEDVCEAVAVDARAELKISQDKMTAFIKVHAPENGGAEITNEQIEALLSEEGIKVRIFQETISDIIENRLYGQAYMIASGTLAVDGQDGEIVDYYSRTQEVKPRSREDGSVDFKHLNIFCNVLENDTICTISEPTLAVDGVDIYGNVIKGRDGKPAVAPQGQNTAVSEDGLRLEAKCCGNLRFEKGQFHVDEVLRIDGSVNNAFGNIEFSGDVIVEGDVCEGYHITAGKNVTVKGTVEGASISAQGDIILSKGINGMNRGILSAGKDVRGKFFENCTVNAKGSVYAESIMNCTVQAEDKIVVKGKRGVIVGGTYMALNLIEARTVGAESNVATLICLGATPDTLKMSASLEREIVNLQQEIDSATKDIQYLEKEAKLRPLSGARKEMFNQRKKQQLVGMMKQNAAKKKYDLLINEIESTKSCRLSCRYIYPPTKIAIGNVSMVIKELEINQYYYYEDSEIKKGMN